jgi:hypothetical protein
MSNDFKINNNFAPYFARLIASQEPDLRGFFKQREFKTDPSVRARFLAYHHANPTAYDELVGLARERKSRGHESGGIKALLEVFRWNQPAERDSA